MIHGHLLYHWYPIEKWKRESVNSWWSDQALIMMILATGKQPRSPPSCCEVGPLQLLRPWLCRRWISFVISNSIIVTFFRELRNWCKTLFYHHPIAISLNNVTTIDQCFSLLQNMPQLPPQGQGVSPKEQLAYLSQVRHTHYLSLFHFCFATMQNMPEKVFPFIFAIAWLSQMWYLTLLRWWVL